jgi:oligo-1,6-glucosidase
MGEQWWKRGTIYQIYPRSFQDSNNDGIGDINGIVSRLDEIAALGAGAIWLSPVYTSPHIDNGYDISDYRSIDPVFGTLADMENLIAGAKKRGIRIIMDLVINHTSDEHDWFQKSCRREDPYAGYYIWSPPPEKRSTPNNWTSFFMEDAWTYNDIRGEYYLHLFHKKQPDLNYKNPAVLEEIKHILRFWLEKGVAGFRCDVINVLWKTTLKDGKKNIMLTGKEHYLCQEENHEIIRALRKILDEYNAFCVGETALVNLEKARLLCGEARHELHEVFYFDHLEVDRRIARFVPKKFRAGVLLKRLESWQRGLEWNALYLENHDQSRIVSHYGAAKTFTRGIPSPAALRNWRLSAKLLATLLFTLRGTPYIYQGQEIGMTNFDFDRMDKIRDIETRNLNSLMKKFHIPAFIRWAVLRASSRDNARTPYQWNSADGAGFSAAAPWLGVNANHVWLNYENQNNDPDSVLSWYRMLLRLRERDDVLVYGEFISLYANKRMMAYQRAAPDGEIRYTVMLNFSSGHVTLNSAARRALRGASVAVSNTGRVSADFRSLDPWEALVVKHN